MRFIAEIHPNGELEIMSKPADADDELVYGILAERFPNANFFFVGITTDIFAD